MKITPIVRDLALHIAPEQRLRVRTAINEALKADLVAESLAAEIVELRRRLAAGEARESELRQVISKYSASVAAIWEA